MPPPLCQSCALTRALILRPKTGAKLCAPCFQLAFENEVHATILAHNLFRPGERVAIGASGGKDSTVLASVLCTLNARHGYALDLVLLSVDEGIAGYRDDSLATVRRNAGALGLELTVVGYKGLYGWSMDEVVGAVGRKGNCTYCGVFRRQALDRGAKALGVAHVVTGHNADDVAETVVMNLLRGDLPRLARATSIVTSSPSSPIKRSKPLKYAYEKEIVLYAHHKKLDYFSTECIYSPEAFRGSARALIKNLERIRPSAILDVVRSGEDMARLVPPEVGGGAGLNGVGSQAGQQPAVADEENEGGCGSVNGRSSGGEMAEMERQLRDNERAEAEGLEVEISSSNPYIIGQRHDRDRQSDETRCGDGKITKGRKGPARTEKKLPKQQMGQCGRCGYLSSQAICKACVLLEGLNRNRPKTEVEVGVDEEESSSSLMRRMEKVTLAGGAGG